MSKSPGKAPPDGRYSDNSTANLRHDKAGIKQTCRTPTSMKKYRSLAVSMIGLGLLALSQSIGAAVLGSGGGTVYVMSNKAKHNSVLVFQRDADGSLAQVQESPTHGAGTGVTLDPL